jgi:hypothetical protein
LPAVPGQASLPLGDTQKEVGECAARPAAGPADALEAAAARTAAPSAMTQMQRRVQLGVVRRTGLPSVSSSIERPGRKLEAAAQPATAAPSRLAGPSHLAVELLEKLLRDEVTVRFRRNLVDWNLRESARTKMRVMVKRLLKKYGYPLDKTEHATQLVRAQAEVVCEEWAA